jgi:hypothetical protein
MRARWNANRHKGGTVLVGQGQDMQAGHVDEVGIEVDSWIPLSGQSICSINEEIQYIWKLFL